MAMPFDICRCTNGTCELRGNCLRWLERDVESDRLVQTRDMHPKDGVCEYQIQWHLRN